MSDTQRNYINGTFVDATSLDRIAVQNPATQEIIGFIPDSDAATVDRAVAAATAAQPAWERLPANERAVHLRAIARGIRAERAEIATLISREQGKVLGLAQVEVDFTADYLDYMAEWARRIEGEVIQSDRAGETILLMRRAIGVTAGILPWNFPFFLIARKLAPALVMGNSIVIKPSEETPLNAWAFARIAHAAGLPAGVFNLVGGRGASTGQALSAHPGVGLISFTGSVATGTRIMQTAAANLTRVNLELGGKAPAIVLADADLDLAATALAGSRVLNSGQVCNCPERVYVARAVAEAFTAKVADRMRAVRYGDPLADPTIDMGPLVNQAGLDKVAAMVERARGDGAEVVLGGSTADTPTGYHFQPTVLAGCRADMEIMRKEIFGPVLPVQTVEDLDEALALANDSEYGLTSSVFTRSLNSAMHAIRGLKFGETYVNRDHFEAMQGFHAGRRKSGIGGADGRHGLNEYSATQVVYLQA